MSYTDRLKKRVKLLTYAMMIYAIFALFSLTNNFIWGNELIKHSFDIFSIAFQLFVWTFCFINRREYIKDSKKREQEFEEAGYSFTSPFNFKKARSQISNLYIATMVLCLCLVGYEIVTMTGII